MLFLLRRARALNLTHFKYLYNSITPTHVNANNMKILLLCSPKVWLEYSYSSPNLQNPTAPREKVIKNALPSHHGVNPVCWGVLAGFDSQFNDAFSLQQTRSGAHGKTSHLLHTGDEEIHPAQKAVLNHMAMWKSLKIFALCTLTCQCVHHFIMNTSLFYVSKQ